MKDFARTTGLVSERALWAFIFLIISTCGRLYAQDPHDVILVDLLGEIHSIENLNLSLNTDIPYVLDCSNIQGFDVCAYEEEYLDRRDEVREYQEEWTREQLAKLEEGERLAVEIDGLLLEIGEYLAKDNLRRKKIIEDFIASLTKLRDSFTRQFNTQIKEEIAYYKEVLERYGALLVNIHSLRERVDRQIRTLHKLRAEVEASATPRAKAASLHLITKRTKNAFNPHHKAEILASEVQAITSELNMLKGKVEDLYSRITSERAITAYEKFKKYREVLAELNTQASTILYVIDTFTNPNNLPFSVSNTVRHGSIVQSRNLFSGYRRNGKKAIRECKIIILQYCSPIERTFDEILKIEKALLSSAAHNCATPRYQRPASYSCIDKIKRELQELQRPGRCDSDCQRKRRQEKARLEAQLRSVKNNIDHSLREIKSLFDKQKRQFQNLANHVLRSTRHARSQSHTSALYNLVRHGESEYKVYVEDLRKIVARQVKSQEQVGEIEREYEETIAEMVDSQRQKVHEYQLSERAINLLCDNA